MNSAYAEGYFDILTASQYNDLKDLYNSVNEAICFILNKVFDIGTRDLYSSIVNNSADTMKSTQEVKMMMETNKIPPPDIELLKKFPISENYGWGREFTREDIFK